MSEGELGHTATRRPRIGVTGAIDPAPDNYVAALLACGAEPIVLSNTVARAEYDLQDLDGLLITGGSDIDPQQYGASKHEQTEAPDPDRDAYELRVAKLATERALPVLMICRGMQIANIAFGGTLHQHIPDIVDGSVIHSDHNRKFEVFEEHTVAVEPSAQLARIIGETRFMTNASHHQAVDVVGQGLLVVARTDDGIIEALERPSAAAFWLATQWHPERLLDADEGRSRKIFMAFLGACRSSQNYHQDHYEVIRPT